MKLTPRNKNYLFALFTFLVVAVVVLLMFFPKYLMNYKWAIIDLKEKNNSVAVLQSEIVANKSTIQGLAQTKSYKEIQQYQIQQDASSIVSEFDYNIFKLHIPSLLITLEDNAKKNDIKIKILYDKAVFGSEDTQLTDTADPNTNVHITNAKDKYHIAGCSLLSDSDLVTTLGEVTNLSIAPCEVCNPPVLSNGVTTFNDTRITSEAITHPIGGTPYTMEGIGGESKAVEALDILPDEIETDIVAIEDIADNQSFDDSEINTIIQTNTVMSQNSTMAVPVLISGSYTNIRNYLSKLYDIDFIEIGYIGLKIRNEKIIDGIMLVNIKYEGAQ